MTFGYYARNGYYGSPEARVEVDRMTELNIEWVCVVVIVLQDTFTSTRQYRDFEMTPADDELRDIIDCLHARGMKVQLRPMLECWDGTQRVHVTFPTDQTIIPGKPIRYAGPWFESMTQRTLHYARLAQRAGCEAYGLDSELDRIVSFNDHWKQVVAAARSAFDGHLTSGHTGRVDFLAELDNNDHWFYDLDSLGASFYHRAAEVPGATKQQMLERLAHWRDHYRAIAWKYGKPFYFAECGCCSTAGAAAHPSGWDNPGGYDGQEQAHYLDAVLETFWNEPWWMGLYWWKWQEHNNRPWLRDDPRGDKGFALYGKPAAEVMKLWYGRKNR